MDRMLAIDPEEVSATKQLQILHNGEHYDSRSCPHFV
jgi:hypothetical protein